MNGVPEFIRRTQLIQTQRNNRLCEIDLEKYDSVVNKKDEAKIDLISIFASFF